MKKFLSLLCVGATAALAFAPMASATPWKFGVLSDTQWVVADDGKNPYSAATDIINQANQAFIANGVQFVIAVGDLTTNLQAQARLPQLAGMARPTPV